MNYADELLAIPEKPKIISGKNYADELLNGQTVENIDPSAGKGASSIPGRPVIGDTREGGASFLTNLRANLAPDTATQIKRYSESMNIPENRFGVVGGDIVYWDQQANTYSKVTPSIGAGNGAWDKFMRAGGNIAAATPGAMPQIAGMAAGAMAGPTGVSIPLAGGVAAATETARQALDKAMAGESVATTDYGYGNIAGQGALAAGGQALGVVANKAFQRNPLGVSPFDRAQATDPDFLRRVQEIQAEAQRRGVDLSAGQATGLRSLMAKERQLGRMPETADQMYDFARQQRDVQVPNAIRQEIAAISPTTGENAIQGFREGADATVKAFEKQRFEAADPLYKEAFAANRSVSSPLIDRILGTPMGRDALRSTAERTQNALQRMASPDPELTQIARELASRGEMAPTKGGVASGLSLRSLDLIKQNMDDAISATAKQVANGTARQGELTGLRETKRAFVKELDRLDATAKAGPVAMKPEGGSYARGRAIWGSESDAVEAVKDGGVGMLKNMEGPDRIGIIRRIFNSGAEGLTPEEISRTRGNFMFAGKKAEWDSGLATWLSDKLDNAMKIGAQGERGNVPGKFHGSVWGDERQQAIVKAALGDPARVDGIGKLMEVMRAAARSLPEGSPTATDLAAMTQGTMGPTARFVGKALSPQTYLNLGAEIAGGIDALRTPAARVKLADALTSPNSLATLKKLRMLSPNSEKALVLTSQLLTDAGVIEIGSATGLSRRGDFAAPAERE